MERYSLNRAGRRVGSFGALVVYFAMILMGCGSKEAPISAAAQGLKKELLGDMSSLTKALAEPVAKQDWEAVTPVLQKSYEEMKTRGKFVPLRIAVLDRDAIVQDRFPPKKQEQLDFKNYEPAKAVFVDKKKTQAMLYLEGTKVFVFIAPLLKNDQVTGAVVMGFPEEELKKWKVSEKDFLSTDFNQ